MCLLYVIYYINSNTCRIGTNNIKFKSELTTITEREGERDREKKIQKILLQNRSQSIVTVLLVVISTFNQMILNISL